MSSNDIEDDYNHLKLAKTKDFYFVAHPLRLIIKVQNGRIDHADVHPERRFNRTKIQNEDEEDGNVRCFICPATKRRRDGRACAVSCRKNTSSVTIERN